MLKFGKTLLVGLSMAVGIGLVSGIEWSSSAAAAGTDYYVATNGNDSSAGTSSAPWKTLQHAADAVPAGSTVHVRGGVYNQKLKITRSGSASQGPIVFTNDGTETPIIDGTGLSVSGIEGLIDLTDVNYVTLQGFEIRNYTTATKDVMPVGIYVHGSGSFINLSGNKVHDIKTRPPQPAVISLAVTHMGSPYMEQRHRNPFTILRLMVMNCIILCSAPANPWFSTVTWTPSR